MKITEIFSKKKPVFSFEFFPPKTPEGEEKLFKVIEEDLKPLAPSFVSVTYGAMGTTRQNTLRIVSQINENFGIPGAAHLTCVGHTRDEIEAILQDLKNRGIENIVPLRGDPPGGTKTFEPVPGGFRYASELVSFIRKHPDFREAFALAVAGYPEGHMECRDLQKDMDHLKIKVDAGADIIVTQLFFDNVDYFDFVERARKAGIHIPIVPGIMPITHGVQIQKFSDMCGSKIPDILAKTIGQYGDDQSSVEAYGIEYATHQCQELLRGGVPGIHFYTLNKSRATRQIYHNLGLPKAV